MPRTVNDLVFRARVDFRKGLTEGRNMARLAETINRRFVKFGQTASQASTNTARALRAATREYTALGAAARAQAREERDAANAVTQSRRNAIGLTRQIVGLERDHVRLIQQRTNAELAAQRLTTARANEVRARAREERSAANAADQAQLRSIRLARQRIALERDQLRLTQERARAETAASSAQGLRGFAASLRSIGLVIPLVGGGLVGLALGLRRLSAGAIRASDTLTRLRSQIRLVSGDVRGMESELISLAQRTRAAFEATVTVFTRTRRAIQSLDPSITAEETLQFTESIAQLVRVSGSSAREASGALIQLSQGLASNRLGGEELRSVMEQIPAVAIRIARGLGIGLGQLREMARAGRLETVPIMQAILAQTISIKNEFENIEPLISDLVTRFQDSATRLGEAVLNAAGLDTALRAALRTASDLADTIAGAITPAPTDREAFIANYRSIVEDLSEAQAAGDEAAVSEAETRLRQLAPQLEAINARANGIRRLLRRTDSELEDLEKRRVGGDDLTRYERTRLPTILRMRRESLLGELQTFEEIEGIQENLARLFSGAPEALAAVELQRGPTPEDLERWEKEIELRRELVGFINDESVRESALLDIYKNQLQLQVAQGKQTEVNAQRLSTAAENYLGIRELDRERAENDRIEQERIRSERQRLRDTYRIGREERNFRTEIARGEGPLAALRERHRQENEAVLFAVREQLVAVETGSSEHIEIVNATGRRLLFLRQTQGLQERDLIQQQQDARLSILQSYEDEITDHLTRAAERQGDLTQVVELQRTAALGRLRDQYEADLRFFEANELDKTDLVRLYEAQRDAIRQSYDQQFNDTLLRTRDVALTTLGSIADTIANGIERFDDNTEGWFNTLNSLFQLAQQFVQLASTFGTLSQGGGIGGFLRGLFTSPDSGPRGSSGIPSFHQGGVIPGIPGRDTLIRAQPGETVLPRGTAPVTITLNMPMVNDRNVRSEVMAMLPAIQAGVTNAWAQSRLAT